MNAAQVALELITTSSDTTDVHYEMKTPTQDFADVGGSPGPGTYGIVARISM